ncbi:MAG: enoyl-CoA hydratase-related protein [Dehalococcoidia bacterium]
MARNETVLFERTGNIGYVTLNRPEKLNAISPGMLREFEEVLDEIEQNPVVRVVVIRGAGRAFSAGYDLNPSAEGRSDRGDPVDDLNRLRWTMQRWLRVWDFPKPVIAQVHGFCLAGATQLCVLTDITIVAEDARIGLPAIPIGGGYISPMWTWLVGPKRAKEMSFVPGSQIDGRTAAEWGFANRAVPAARLEDDVRQLAERIAVVPAKILQLKKASVNRTMELQGFRTAIMLGTETDALLHYSEPVEKLSGMIRESGLKGAIDRFNRGEGHADGAD